MNILKLNGLYVHYKLDSIEVLAIFFLILHFHLQYNFIDDVTIYMICVLNLNLNILTKELVYFTPPPSPLKK